MSEQAQSQSRALKPIDALKQFISSPQMTAQIKAALPAHVPAERFVRVTMTALSQTPQLAECDRSSLLTALMTCASLGLLPDTALGQAYLIPYQRKVQLQFGYRGLLDLARRSGEIISVESGIVYEKDTVEFVLGDDAKLTIRPFLDGDPGAAKFGYCVVKLRDGGVQREVMSVEQIEKIRKGSPTANSPAWKNSWDQMGRKTVLRRALKYCPCSAEVVQAMELENAYELDAARHQRRQTVDGVATRETDSPRQSKLAQLAARGGPGPTPEPEPTQEPEPDSREPPPIEGEVDDDEAGAQV